ncbi:MAG: hypothetical protein V3W37_11545 [Candidatus Binatia bacterium]
MHVSTAGSPQSSSDTYTLRGYCALCTAQCATIATVEDGRVTRLDPDHDHPNGGMICIKGKAAPALVYHPDDLTIINFTWGPRMSLLPHDHACGPLSEFIAAKKTPRFINAVRRDSYGMAERS